MGFAAAGVTAALAVFAIARDRRSFVHRCFAAGAAVLAIESLLGALAISARDPALIVFRLRWQALASAFVPGVWLLFSLSYARGNYGEFLQRWKSALRLAFLLPPGVALALWPSLVIGVYPGDAGEVPAAALGRAGLALHAMLLAAAIAILANLERTLRASTGTMRWQIKFMVLGVGLLFVVRLYVSSQTLLYASLHLPLLSLGAASLLVADALIAWALLRSRLFAVDLYPSHRFLFRSIVVMLAGVYLLIVGVLAHVVTRWGGTAFFPLKALLILVALLGLSVVLLSNRLRQRFERFVSRQFRRPLYDHRAVWSGFTGRTARLTRFEDYCREAAHVVSETFEVLSVTIWTIDGGRDRPVFGGSTSLSEAQARELAESWSGAGELAEVLKTRSDPVDIDRAREAWVESLRRCNPDFFRKGGNRICVPLVTGGQALGIMTLGDRVGGLPYTVEEFDLLKTLGGQIAARLLNIRLSAKLLEARELQAFQTMSTFVVHDLKNTASTLSLMLQNLPKHFEDPAFRQDALDAMGKSVARINEMIRRLTLLRQKLELRKAPADLADVLRAALAAMDEERRSRIDAEPGPAPAPAADAERLQSVVTNLLFNALDASPAGGRVRAATSLQGPWAVIAVADGGCGMTRDFVERSLFRPFQSTKKDGMGIGLFQSRMIVEAHGGRIDVESAPDAGSTFKVLIPAQGG